MHLKDNILLIRKLLKETQPIFAKRFTGVSTGMQKTYESGGTPPGKLYLEELSEIAGVTIDELVKTSLKKGDVRLGRKVKIVKMEDRFAADQLFAMFLEVSGKQTGILENIQKEMARREDQATMNKKLDELSSSLKSVEENQDGDFEILTVLLKRDVDREVKGNEEKAREKLNAIVQKIGPALNSKQKKSIRADGST